MVDPDDPDFYDEDDECWNCGGEGVIYSCFEEFACIDPESGCDDCARRCEVCRPRPTPPTGEGSPANKGGGDAD